VSPRTSDHDRWLAEAGNALADAERLTGLLALTRPRHDLVLAALQAQIMTLRREIERLQRERAGERRREFHPEWMEYSVWHAPAG
jgi:hypothetical protein